jgi:hypothetical protein
LLKSVAIGLVAALLATAALAGSQKNGPQPVSSISAGGHAAAHPNLPVDPGPPAGSPPSPSGGHLAWSYESPVGSPATGGPEGSYSTCVVGVMICPLGR